MHNDTHDATTAAAAETAEVKITDAVGIISLGGNLDPADVKQFVKDTLGGAAAEATTVIVESTEVQAEPLPVATPSPDVGGTAGAFPAVETLPALTAVASEGEVPQVAKPSVPSIEDIDTFKVTRVARQGHWRNQGAHGTFRGHPATIHVSNIADGSQKERDEKFAAIKEGDEFAAEVIAFEWGENYKVTIECSKRLADSRQALEAMIGKPVDAVVREDVGENPVGVFVTLPGGHRARVFVGHLKDRTRNERDARVKTFKKDDPIKVTVTGFKRHPKVPMLNVDCREFDETQSAPKPQTPARPNTDGNRHANGRSPLSAGRNAGPANAGRDPDAEKKRAKAEANRAARRMRDQELRNKMKGSGSSGGKGKGGGKK